jgi:sulfite reductase alpha subunit-like flavoprotein
LNCKFQSISNVPLGSWDPGDIAVLHPCTQAGDVQAILERFKWTSIADSPLQIQSHSLDQPLPSYLTNTVTTLRTLFASVLDISCVPRKTFFELLVHFTSDDQEREKFEEFTSLSAEGACRTHQPEMCTYLFIGQDDLYEYTHRVRRTILEVLQDFRHVTIPLEYIFDVFPLIRPRQFSIANSSRYLRSKQTTSEIHVNDGIGDGSKDKRPGTRTTMELCIAIVNYKTRMKAPRRGLCTTWLSGLKPSSPEDGAVQEPIRVRVGLRKGALRLPSSTEGKPGTPVICIGPGTGVAPMRATIQERISRGQTGMWVVMTLAYS